MARQVWKVITYARPPIDGIPRDESDYCEAVFQDGGEARQFAVKARQVGKIARVFPMLDLTGELWQRAGATGRNAA